MFKEMFAMLFRTGVNWIKRSMIETAFGELKAEFDEAGAVDNAPPAITHDVESTPVLPTPEPDEPEPEPTATTRGRKKAAKKKT